MSEERNVASAVCDTPLELLRASLKANACKGWTGEKPCCPTTASCDCYVVAQAIAEIERLNSRLSEACPENYRMGWDMAIDTVLGLLDSNERGALRKDVTIAELADHIRLFKVREPK